MRYIIVPTDFSGSANNAMYYGINLAKETGATVVLFHAYQLPMMATEVSVMMSAANIDELKTDAENRLAEIKSTVEKDSMWSVKVFTEVRMGNAADQLESFCDEIKPFAVVMGSRSQSSFHRALFGSTTLAAIRRLNWPVIAVPPGKEYRSIRKIGFASDYQHVGDTTPVSYIHELVNTFHAELHVLNVDLHNRNRTPEKLEQVRQMQGLLHDMHPHYHFIEHADVELAINDFADENQLDLLITVPKKHSIIDSMFHKSGTKQILSQAHVPVLCVH